MGNTSTPSAPYYQSVTSNNPYAKAYANYFGNGYTLNKFLTQQNKTIEETVPQLYQRLLNPTLDDAVSQARTQAFTKAFNAQSKNAFENNLINPLSERNMLRSSLMNDMTKNFQETQASQIADFNTELLSNSVSDTQALIELMMNQYKTNASYGQNAVSNALTSASQVNSFNQNNYSKQLQNSWNNSKLLSKSFSVDDLVKLLAVI